MYFSVTAHLCLHKFDVVMYDICVRNSQESFPKWFVSTVARADSTQVFFFLFFLNNVFFIQSASL